MARPLKQALEQHLSGWRKDIPEPWQPFFADVEPDFDAIPPTLLLEEGKAGEKDERIHPLRKGHRDPDAPVGSHVFKALDDLAPDRVRAVLVGQDPYPNFADATGRSFEQGRIANWRKGPTKSLRRIVQVLAEHRWPNRGWSAADADWPHWVEAFDSGAVPMQRPAELFDHWGREGVLCLNLGLTLSRFDKKLHKPPRPPAQAAHMALWTPVIQAVLSRLAQRPNGELLLMLWGGNAQEAVEAMNLPAISSRAGTGGRLVTVHKAHPAFDRESPPGVPFLEKPNVFAQANQALVAAALQPINW